MEELTDPADWPEDRHELRSLDKSLRCSICQDFFSAPVVLPCSHTYCSSCIRANFDHKVSQNNPTNCPQCRKLCGPAQLQPNVCLREAVHAYIAARPILLDAVQRSRLPVALPANSTSPQHHPKAAALEQQQIEDQDEISSSQSSDHARDPSVILIPSTSDEGQASGPQAHTRSSKRHKTEPPLQATLARPPSRANSVEPRSRANSAEPAPPAAPTPAPPAAAPPLRPGYISCPVCTLSIKEEFINPHLDGCLAKSERNAQPIGPPAAGSGAGRNGRQLPGSRHVVQPQLPPGRDHAAASRQPQQAAAAEPEEAVEELKAPGAVAWNLVKSDKEARAKLQQAGLPTHGTRQELEKRYINFRRFVSVAKDSGRSVTMPQLVQEFVAQERRAAAGRTAALPPMVPAGAAEIGSNDFATLARELRMRQQQRQRQGSAANSADDGAAAPQGNEGEGCGAAAHRSSSSGGSEGAAASLAKPCAPPGPSAAPAGPMRYNTHATAAATTTAAGVAGYAPNGQASSSMLGIRPAGGYVRHVGAEGAVGMDVQADEQDGVDDGEGEWEKQQAGVAGRGEWEHEQGGMGCEQQLAEVGAHGNWEQQEGRSGEQQQQPPAENGASGHWELQDDCLLPGQALRLHAAPAAGGLHAQQHGSVQQVVQVARHGDTGRPSSQEGRDGEWAMGGGWVQPASGLVPARCQPEPARGVKRTLSSSELLQTSLSM